MSGFTCQGCGVPIEKTWASGRNPKWCSERCRKRSYGDPCVDCGTRTRYGAERARVPEPRCVPCSAAHRTHWTRELIVERIREWAHVYGEAPAAHDWMPWSAEHVIHDPERAERFLSRKGHWPGGRSVFDRFGSWNAAIEAAGFAPRAGHGGDGNGARRRDRKAAA